MAELAECTRAAATVLVRRMTALAIRTGQIVVFPFNDYEVRVLVLPEEEHATYLVISAEGGWNAHMFAMLLSSFPGISPDDWMPEPGGSAPIEPEPGELMWSALLPPDEAVRVLAEFPE